MCVSLFLTLLVCLVPVSLLVYSVCVCIFLSLFSLILPGSTMHVHIFGCMSRSLSLCLPGCHPACMSVCLLVCLSGCLALPHSVCLPGSKLPIHTSLCLCFSICLSVCLSLTLLATIFSLVRTFDFVLFHNRNPSWKTSTASSTRARCLTYLTTRSWTASPWT